MNSAVRLGVSLATTTPTSFSARGFEAVFPCAGTLGYSLSDSPVAPSSLSARKCGTTQFSSHGLAAGPLHPSRLSPPLLPAWMNVSSVTPWLSDFHTVRFSGSSGCFLFLNWLLSFFWLCEEANHIYLGLHLGQKSSICRKFS